MAADFDKVTVSISLVFNVAIVYLHNFEVKVAMVCMFFFGFYGIVCSHIVGLHLSSSQVTYT